MSTITNLEYQIDNLQEEIRQLQSQRSELEAFWNEAMKAGGEVDQQLQRKQRIADKFRGLITFSTFAAKMAEKIADCYGGKNRDQLLSQFESVKQNIHQAIQKIEREIETKRRQISRLQNQIEQIREEERRRAEAARRAEEAKRAEEAGRQSEKK